MKANFTNLFSRLLLLACFVIPTVAKAQQQAPKPNPTPPSAGDQGEQSETIFIRRVRLPITVVDKKGQFVPGLTKNDFVILEDDIMKVTPEKIYSVKVKATYVNGEKVF